MADVSGSMMGKPMSVAIAMAMWISGMATEEWRNMFLTFSAVPTFVTYDDSLTLREKIEIISQAPWGMNTNLSIAFKLMLDKASKECIPAAEMPKQLIIISDMQFDYACGDTNLEDIRKQYSETNDPEGIPYEMPTIVFWNVSGVFNGAAAPATMYDQNVIMLSGFSKDLIKVLLNNEEFPTPYEIMVKTLSDSRYDLMN